MGRKCAVPHCYTGYRKCKEKASLYKVPEDDFFLSKWQEAIAREDRPITPKDYVCEKHFKDEDILRKRLIKDIVEQYQRPKLKPDAIPSIFPDLPEFILKMTKKRRKIPTETSENSVEKSKNIEDESLKTGEKDTPNKCNDETCEAIMDNEAMVLNDDEITIKTEIDEPMDASVDESEDDPDGPKMHRCNECKYKTKYAHNLRTHKTKHLSGDDAYMRCEYCVTYKTKWESTYLNHMKTKHGINMRELLKCSFCQFKTKVEVCLTRHCEREHRGQETKEAKKFKCEYLGCDYEAESNALLTVHSLVHKEAEINDQAAKTFSCTECHFETNSKRHIATHMKSAHNSGDEPVIPISSKNSSRKGDGKKSKTISKFKCSRCPYRTNSQNSLENHLVKHQFTQQRISKQIKTLKCPNCPFTSSFSHIMEAHQRTSCRVNTFNCQECPLTFNTKPDYIKHILTHRNTTIEIVKPRKNSAVSNASQIQGFDTVLIKEENHSDDEHGN